MIFHDHDQGSDLWLASRAGVITASRFKDARDRTAKGLPSSKCSGYAAQVALERIAGRPIDRFFETWQMREGKEQEEFARIAYENRTGHLVEEVGFITTDDSIYGYSPDGLIAGDGLVEIKTVLSGDVALRVCGHQDLSGYLDQCIGGLWLTGRKWIDLVIWCPALAPVGKQMTIHHIGRDENGIERLEADLVSFKNMVDENEAILRMKEAA
ncbi:MAG: exonuclease [Herminiimonas sp.]|nr:exonuclease [Herminiimonas sp.]